MNSIPNRKEICNVLLEEAEHDASVTVLCSDSRGSASMSDFAEKYPEQFVEMGIAEQDLVGVAAGLAKCGKKAYVTSPASFLTTRSYEQCKVDVAYSDTNVKLVGISGGVSYGALGMSHHSAQDIAAFSAIPNMRVYLPSDRFLTGKLMRELYKDEKPAYIRVGRGAVEDIYDENLTLELNHAITMGEGKDVTIIACGEMVQESCKAAKILEEKGIHVTVVDMYCVKPLDREVVLKALKNSKAIVTVEEHSIYGGLGAAVSQIAAENGGVTVKNIALPDEPVIAGNSKEIFDYYGMTGEKIAEAVAELLNGIKE